jgi:WD40 repeat protein
MSLKAYFTDVVAGSLYKTREESEIFTVKFSADEDFLACGLGNGKIKLYSIRSNSLVTTLEVPLLTKTPITCIAFRPDNTSFKTKNILAATCTYLLTTLN